MMHGSVQVVDLGAVDARELAASRLKNGLGGTAVPQAGLLRGMQIELGLASRDHGAFDPGATGTLGEARRNV